MARYWKKPNERESDGHMHDSAYASYFQQIVQYSSQMTDNV